MFKVIDIYAILDPFRLIGKVFIINPWTCIESKGVECENIPLSLGDE